MIKIKKYMKPLLIFTLGILLVAGCSLNDNKSKKEKDSADNSLKEFKELFPVTGTITTELKFQRFFHVGTPASNYTSSLAVANDSYTDKNGDTIYRYWIEGKSPKKEGDGYVKVVVSGSTGYIQLVDLNVFKR